MKSEKSGGINIIVILMIVVLVYNVFYWPGKFFPTESPRFVLTFYISVKSHWGLMMLLEFLGIASLFVDAISKFDEYREKSNWKLIATFLFTCAFIARFLLGMIDMYMEGGVR
ncbi:MAG: hypothetical protein R2809_11660 [Flavobacteriales bacterium]